MDNKFPLPKQHLIGHRGVAGLKPENTLCGFSMAAELGLNWIEFDIQLSKDDVWVVLHDETLDRTTNGRGLLANQTQAELATLEAGLWFKPPVPGQHIPTLTETLQLARELNLFCNVELKVPETQAERYVRLFIDFMNNNSQLIKDRVILSTFNSDCALQLRKNLQDLTPNVPIAFLTESVHPDMLRTIKSQGFAALNCDVEKFTKDWLQHTQKLQIPVFLYTVNDESTARYWIANGVAGVFTDRPDLLQNSSATAY